MNFFKLQVSIYPAPASQHKSARFAAPRDPHVSHMTTEHDNNHTAFHCDLQLQIPKHPVTTHTRTHPKHLEATATQRRKKNERPVTAAHATCPTSPAAAALHEKTPCFALLHPPQHKSNATILPHIQVTTSRSHHLLSHHLPRSSRPKVITSLSYHTSLSHHCPKVPPLSHHFPKSSL